ncbi:DUF5658 family protein [Robertmurraya mangrovi]|uniref:DUF5658 family protein n=1 Tax=Robertmurraya mangrovi TaxID=3098077 RepID=UPI003899A3CB
MRSFFLYLGILNLFDAFATFYGLSINEISELNPVMSILYERNPFIFLGTKVGLSIVLFSLTGVKKGFNSLTLRTLTIFSTILYSCVCFIHLVWVIRLF